MFYWLFTDGYLILQSLLWPLLCLSVTMPILTSVALGTGIRRSRDESHLALWQHGCWIATYLLVFAAITGVCTAAGRSGCCLRATGRERLHPVVCRRTGYRSDASVCVRRDAWDALVHGRCRPAQRNQGRWLAARTSRPTEDTTDSARRTGIIALLHDAGVQN